MSVPALPDGPGAADSAAMGEPVLPEGPAMGDHATPVRAATAEGPATPEGPATAEGPATPESAATGVPALRDGAAGVRSADLRIARLHLRGGTHALARAELEALAGRDELDRDGILDLAEVRWRTGDLAGAAVAAAAWLEDGDEAGDPGALAHAISAEAAAARGVLDAAAAHVEAAMGWIGDARSLDAVLAGVVAGAAWPSEAGVVAAPTAPSDHPALSPARPSSPVRASSPARAPSPARPAPGPTTAPAAAAGARKSSPPAAELIAAGAALVGAAPERASVLLALALRADREAAASVLEVLDAVEPQPVRASFAFLRAEALRAAGRHEESRIAYASAERLALAPAETGTPGSPQ
jgi:hypothetical protein